MSMDDADDIQAAEDLLCQYAAYVAGLGVAWNAVKNSLGPGYDPAAVMVLEGHLEATGLLFDAYCRPSCGHADYLNNDGEDGNGGGPGDVPDCQDEYCGCPCHSGEEWHDLLRRWVPVD